MSERTAVYRLYDADDEPLYIGISTNPKRRIGEHGYRMKPTRVEITWYDSQDDAKDAERKAIRREQPRHNKAWKKARWYGIPDPAAPLEDQIAKAADKVRRRRAQLEECQAALDHAIREYDALVAELRDEKRAG